MATLSCQPQADASVRQPPEGNTTARPRVQTSADEAAAGRFRLPEEQVPLSSVFVVSVAASLLFAASMLLAPGDRILLAQVPSSVIAVAIVVVALQSAVIIGLLLSRSRRRRMELSFRDSEEAMALAASSANIGLWRWDIASDRVRATPHCRMILRLADNEPTTLRTFLNVVHPDDRTRLRQAIDRAVETREDSTSSTASSGRAERRAGSPPAGAPSMARTAVPCRSPASSSISPIARKRRRTRTGIAAMPRI